MRPQSSSRPICRCWAPSQERWVGLPAPVVKEHLAAATMDELMRDAIYEVLNVASAAVSTEGRAVFIKMVTDPAYIDGAAEQALKKSSSQELLQRLGGRLSGGQNLYFLPIRTGWRGALLKVASPVL